MNFLEKTKTLMLVHTNMHTALPGKGMVNLMLTPQFYTLKREALPVKYAHQAKRIAPSLFDGLLDYQERYKYFVSKEEESWLFIAYNEEKIKDFLKTKGIDLSRVNKIYFAEQAQQQYTAPVLMGEDEALVNLNGTVTIVPRTALSTEVVPIELDESFIPKKGITFSANSTSLIGTKEAYILAGILILFAGMYMAEGFRYQGDGALEKEEMQKLLESYPSLSSSYTRNSILDKYRVIDKKERKKRESINALSRMNFKGSTLMSLIVSDKKFEAKFNCTNKNSIDRLKVFAKDAKLHVDTINNSNNLTIKGTL